MNLLSSLAVNNINMDGGAIIYGQSDKGESWAKIFRGGNEFVIEMAFGIWNFTIITYSGPYDLQGPVECGLVNNVNIANVNEVIDIKINGDFCTEAGLRKISVKPCGLALLLQHVVVSVVMVRFSLLSLE